MREIHEYDDYKRYLVDALGTRGRAVKGVRSRLAEALGCRPGYISQVLDGKADLNPDQAETASTFLGHSEPESLYFLLLVLRARATGKALQDRLGLRMEKVREELLDLSKRFRAGEVSEEHRQLVYSSWHYLAALAMVSVPSLRSLEAISERLGLPLARTSAILEDLAKAGMISFDGATPKPALRRTHLGKSSTMLARHHVNWRNRAIQDIEAHAGKSLHFSSVVSLSAKDLEKLRARFTQWIEEANAVIGPSKEEKVAAICLDLFEL